MSIPIASGQQVAAKFTHDQLDVGLRLQAFVLVRDAARRVATLRLDGYDGWTLPGETMRVNEAPAEAAERVAKTWFASPLADLRLVSCESYPATGPDDRKWYLVFLFEARAEGELKGTPDTLEIAWAEPGKAPGEWAMSHADVWARLPR